MTTFEILILALAGVAAVAAIIGAILAGRKKTDDLTPQIKQLTTRVAEQQKNTSDEFARNRMELSKQLEVMQGKLAEMTKANFEQRITLNETVTKSLNDIRDRTVQENERLVKVVEAAIGKMQESNEKKLDEMRATVDEKLTSTLTTRLNSSFKTVSEQLENLYKSLGEMKELSAGVTDNVGALNRVLTNVKARGTWAEVQLETILDQTIPNMYEKNIATGEKDSERVEFAIRIPASDDKSRITYLPVDSKFPMEDYVRLCTAADHADPDAVKAARKALEDRVLSEAKMIKKYINVPNTTPFAIMYLATEGLYAEIVSSSSGILEKIQNECNVMVAGPSTITALLNSLSMGFKTVAINEKANEVRVLLGAAKAQYENFSVILEKAKKKIDDAGKTLDDAQKRNTIIRKKLRTVEDLEQLEAASVLALSDNNFTDDAE
mgnify:FL=1